jgi:hypothetical protein
MVVRDACNPAIFGPIVHNGAERLIAYPAVVWVLVFGGSLLGREAAPS